MPWYETESFWSAAATTVTALFGGGVLGAWLTRRKVQADAEVTLAGGYQSLLHESRTERERLEKRVDMLELKVESLQLDRKILQEYSNSLEVELLHHNIKIPSMFPQGD